MASPHMLRNVEGIDTANTLMPAEDIDKLLQDPFARLALLPLDVASRPLTLNQVVQVMVPAGTTEFQGQSFFVGDGSQVKYKKEPKLDRSLRFVWVRVPQQATQATARDVPAAVVPINTPLADIMAVAGTNSNSATTFLQVASWDSKNQWFNYYERERDTSPEEWVWVGNSMHAVLPATKGKGPFMGHINGSLVMKELKLPWNNWHSSQVTIDACLAPDDPIRNDPLFINRQQADALQTIVESGIAAWTASRITTIGRTFGADGSIVVSVKDLLTPLFGNTTANFITSSTRSNQPDFGNGTPFTPIDLPLTFFVNSDLLGNTKLPLSAASNPTLDLSSRFKVPYKEIYEPTIQKLNYNLVGFSTDPNDNQPISIPGDTFFAFLVPEVAKEDQQVVIELLKSKLLSPRFVTCVLMVDFVNPIYSPGRQYLLDLALEGNEGGNITTLETEMVKRIGTAANAERSVAMEFMKWWAYEDQAQLASAANTTINAYLAAVSARCATAEGFEQYARLAVSRCRSFRSVDHNAQLDEFALTFPSTSIPANALPLYMTPAGQVVDMEPAQVALLVAAKAAQAPSRYRCEAASAVRSSRGCPFARRPK